jgi:hypothetical protein
MSVDGGGWQMCYTTNKNVGIRSALIASLMPSQVHLSTETKSLNVSAGVVAQYGQNGYRSDCRFTPFNEVVSINHDTAQIAWFKQYYKTVFTMAGATANSYWSTSTTAQTLSYWQGFGAAVQSGGYWYQLLVCDSFNTRDTNGLGVGLFFSGVLNPSCCFAM